MICVTSLLLAALALPQQTPAGSGVRNAAQSGAETAAGDPFQPDEALRKALGLDAQRAKTDEFNALDDVPALPTMRMRGYLKLAGKDRAAAIVDVQGVGSYSVRAGEKLSFSLPGRTQTRPTERREPDASAPTRDAGVVVREQVPIVLRIDRVGPDGVVVEVGTLGEFLIIR